MIPLKKTVAPIGRFTLIDPETAKEIEIDPASYSFQKTFKDYQNLFEQKTKQIFNQAGVEVLQVSTHEDHAERLLQFLKRRKQKR